MAFNSPLGDKLRRALLVSDASDVRAGAALFLVGAVALLTFVALRMLLGADAAFAIAQVGPIVISLLWASALVSMARAPLDSETLGWARAGVVFLLVRVAASGYVLGVGGLGVDAALLVGSIDSVAGVCALLCLARSFAGAGRAHALEPAVRSATHATVAASVVLAGVVVGILQLATGADSVLAGVADLCVVIAGLATLGMLCQAALELYRGLGRP